MNLWISALSTLTSMADDQVSSSNIIGYGVLEPVVLYSWTVVPQFPLLWFVFTSTYLQ